MNIVQNLPTSNYEPKLTSLKSDLPRVRPLTIFYLRHLQYVVKRADEFSVCAISPFRFWAVSFFIRDVSVK